MKLYLVRNKEGKFFRAIGYGGYGPSWVDIEKAKWYSKAGQAKSRITYFAKAHPEFGVPDLLEFEIDLSKANVIDMVHETIAKAEVSRRALGRKMLAQKYYSSYYQNRLNELDRKIAKLKNG